MKTVVYMTIFASGLLIALVSGFYGMIDLIGREHVVANILLAPLVAYTVTAMYCVLFEFAERIRIADVRMPENAENCRPGLVFKKAVRR